MCFSLQESSEKILFLSSASREQLRCRKSSAASGEEARTQAYREVLVRGRSGKRTKPFLLKMHLLEKQILETGMQVSNWDVGDIDIRLDRRVFRGSS